MKRYHMIIDLDNTTMPIVREHQEQHLLNWLDAILNVVDMKVISGPHIKYGENSPEGGQEGFSLVAIIDFSSITVHHFNNANEVKVDIFSCKPFNPKLVEGVCRQYFGDNIRFKNIIVV